MVVFENRRGSLLGGNLEMRNFGTMSPLFALLGGAVMALGFGDNRCTAAESETAPPPGIYAPDEWQFSSRCPWEEMAAAAARRVAEELPDHFDNGSEWVDPATLADAERDAYAAAQQDAEAGSWRATTPRSTTTRSTAITTATSTRIPSSSPV